jgi:hypothetical protein
MREVIMRLADVPIARMFVLAGIVFLLVAVMGKIEGKIEPGQVGRIGASVFGVILMIIGVAMQYEEMHEVRQERMAVLQQAAVAAVTSANVAVKTADARAAASAEDNHGIKVVSGTYGRNCNGKAGNATISFANACDGRTACDYAVEPVTPEDYPANCASDFAAEWKCGGAGTVYSAILPADAVTRKEKLHLACPG